MTATTTRARERRADPRSPWVNIDWGLVAATVVIATFGVAMVYSATHRALEGNGADPLFYAKRQIVFVGLGVVAMGLVVAVDHRWIRDRAVLVYLAILPPLVAVLALGTDVKGDRSSFQLPGFQVQPSELAKPAVIVALAAYFAAYEGEVDLGRFVRAALIAGVPMVLILAEPDLGTTLVFVAIAMGAFLVGGARAGHIALAIALAVSGVGLILYLQVLPAEQQDRLTAFLSDDAPPELRYNAEQAEIAAGNGGLTGTGYLEGTQTSLDFVPEQHTDFIFTAVAEEFGFLGSCVLLSLYGFVLWRLWAIARRARGLYETVVAAGVVAMLAFHVFQNVGMTVGIMPITGIPLPFMSHGGSSTIAAFASIGLAVGIHARRWQ